MDKKISQIITDVCHREGIEYRSINPNFIELCTDAKRLGECYMTILSLIDEIDDILCKHKIKQEFKEKIENELKGLSDLKHDLTGLAQRIIMEEKYK